MGFCRRSRPQFVVARGCNIPGSQGSLFVTRRLPQLVVTKGHNGQLVTRLDGDNRNILKYINNMYHYLQIILYKLK